MRKSKRRMYEIQQTWQQCQACRRPRRERCLNFLQSMPHVLAFLIVCLCLAGTTNAAFIYDISNCLPSSTINSNPAQLQWTPLNASVVFEPPNYDLNMTIFGNLSGSYNQQPPPPSNDPGWYNSSDLIFDKIPNQFPGTSTASTLFQTIKILGYAPVNEVPSFFCDAVHGGCPVIPSFNATGPRDVSQLSSFTVVQPMNSSYRFTAINAYLSFVLGDEAATEVGCVHLHATPWLGTTLDAILLYMPLVVLLAVGISVVVAGIYSPWGTSDIFRWTSNYGRDANQLRLITPGFGDCLQYLQFVVFTGGLSLSYPGFYQPVVSRVSWSALIFNESFVSHETTDPVRDGIYVLQGQYGLSHISQLVGLGAHDDLWAGMMVWLCVIILAVLVLIQAYFAVEWIWRWYQRDPPSDLVGKNVAFCIGNVIRIVFNFFLLPLVALSTFQLVVTSTSPTYTYVLAAITLAILLGFAVWLLRVIVTARERSEIFDNLPTVLMYGPLYNTYTDRAATFALVPAIAAGIRGIAIGAVQPSGLAQIILLAITEVVFIIMLNAFRPFASHTSMNTYHTIFATVRLITVLLMVAFLPSLETDPEIAGWIAYVILLLHALVLVAGFFLHALSTLIEVIVRLRIGEGHKNVANDDINGNVKGSRQLKHRNNRHSEAYQASMMSDALINPDNEPKSPGARSRSMSAGSYNLLNRQSIGPDGVAMFGSMGPNGYTPMTPATPAEPAKDIYSPLSPTGVSHRFAPLAARNNPPKLRPPSEGYFRQPRTPRSPNDPQSPNGKGHAKRLTWSSEDWARSQSGMSGDVEAYSEQEPPSSRQTKDEIIPPLLGRNRAQSVFDTQPSNVDYATREVDFYYGVRGPALSNQPARRLGTGPANPIAPVLPATSWLRSLFSGKQKEKTKGFEVVRSMRAPEPTEEGHLENIALEPQEPYHDDPERSGIPLAIKGEGVIDLGDETDAIGAGRIGEVSSPRRSRMNSASKETPAPQLSLDLPDPSLGGDLLKPETGEETSWFRRTASLLRGEPTPPVPRKSSKRASSADLTPGHSRRLSNITGSPNLSLHHRGVSDVSDMLNWPLPAPDFAEGIRNHSRKGSNLSAVSALSDDEADIAASAPSFPYHRPDSMGSVARRRAGSHLGQAPSAEASTAEIVDA